MYVEVHLQDYITEFKKSTCSNFSEIPTPVLNGKK